MVKIPFLYYNDLSEKANRLIKVYWIIHILMRFAGSIVNVFFFLYLLQFISISQLGLVFSAGLTIVVLADFPTGALSDYVGHNKILSLAFTLKALGILLMILKPEFIFILIAYLIRGLGISQESGAIDAWFQNNFMILTTNNESSSQIYGEMNTDLLNILRILSLVIYILSGVLATIFGREFLMILHFIGLLVISIFVYAKMKDTPEYKEHSNKDNKDQTSSIEGWINKMKDTIVYFMENKYYGFFFLLMAIIYANTGNLMSIFSPIIIETFAGNDLNIGIFNFVVSLLGILWTQLSKNLIDRKKRKEFEWYYLVMGIMVTYGFGYIIETLYYIFFRPSSGFNLILFFGFIVIRQIRVISSKFYSMNYFSIMIKLMPDEMRNSVFSFFFTIRSFTAIILVYVSTNLIKVNQSDLSNVLIVVSSINIFIATILGGMYKFRIKGLIEKGEFYPNK